VQLEFAVAVCVCVCVYLATVSKLTWNNRGKTILNQTILIDGINQTLSEVSSLTIDAQNNLYVLDKFKHRILRLDQQRNVFLRAGHVNGTSGTDQYSLNQPNDLLVDSQSTVYVADTMNHRVQMFLDGSRRGQTVFGTGQSGSSANQLDQPMSLALDSSSNMLYIADYGNNRIIRVNLSMDSNRNRSVIFIGAGRADAPRNTYVDAPISIRFDVSSLSLVIAQKRAYNVVRWPLSALQWTFVAGSVNGDLNGTSRTLFDVICSISVDVRGYLYVVDCVNERIQYFADQSAKGQTIAGVIRAKGNNSYLFSHPTAITSDSKMNLYVSDSLNYRIQVFELA
jgi:hypothetical protein